MRAGDNSGRSKGFSRAEGDDKGDNARVPNIFGCEAKLMCVGRGVGGACGRGDIGWVLTVVSVCVLVCMSGCVGFGSRWDTMAPILYENMEEEANREWNGTYFECVFA